MNAFAFNNRVCHLDCGVHRVPVYVKDITMTTDGTTYVVDELKIPDRAMYTDYTTYCRYDLELTSRMIGMYKTYKIKNVIFNDPATIVFWTDGTKTVVKAENEPFDPEKGLAMAIAKKHFGNKGNYFNEIKKWTETYDECLDMSIIRSGVSSVCDDLMSIIKHKKMTKEEMREKILDTISLLADVEFLLGSSEAPNN